MNNKIIAMLGTLLFSFSISNAFANIVTVWNGTQVSVTVETKEVSMDGVQVTEQGNGADPTKENKSVLCDTKTSKLKSSKSTVQLAADKQPGKGGVHVP